MRIDGSQNPDWEDVLLKTAITSKQPVDLAVQRGNDILDKKLLPESDASDQLSAIGVWPDQPLIVTHLESSMPAAKAGLRLGDQIAAINGTPMRSIFSVIHLLQANGDKPVDVTVLRGGETLHLNVTPSVSEEGGQKNYRLGFASEPKSVGKLPFVQAFQRSLQENKRFSLLIVDLIHKLVERKASMKQLEGPIGIARASGDAARQPGWTPLLGLMAMISLNLGILNLLPIPILDGGIILLLAIEAIMRRDISLRIKERIYQTAFVFLVLFFVVVIYNDIMKALPGLAQRLP